MEFESGFRIILWSNPEYENLTAEISFRGDFVAEIIRKDDQVFIKFDLTAKDEGRTYCLDEFLQAVAEARKRLTDR